MSLCCVVNAADINVDISCVLHLRDLTVMSFYCYCEPDFSTVSRAVRKMHSQLVRPLRGRETMRNRRYSRQNYLEKIHGSEWLQ